MTQRDRTLHIVVTQEDIDHGVTGNGEFCPVAMAIRRAYGSDIHVGFTYAKSLLNSDVYAPLPLWVQRAIKRFDECGTMDPMEFDLTFSATGRTFA